MSSKMRRAFIMQSNKLILHQLELEATRWFLMNLLLDFEFNNHANDVTRFNHFFDELFVAVTEV